MARRKNIWERLQESTEGPTVTVALPREWAEELLHSLAQSLEMDDMGGDDAAMDDMGGDDMDLDMGMDGGDEGGPDELDFGGDDMMPAGDGDDEDDGGIVSPRKGPGRPPGSKNKPKDDGGSKKKPADDKKKAPKKDDDKGDDDEDDTKDESAEADGFRPQTALGESVRRLGAYTTGWRPVRGR